MAPNVIIQIDGETLKRNLEERTPLVGEILISGFEAILHTITENAKKGESTDIMYLVKKLRIRIIEACGYDYPLVDLADVFETWANFHGHKVPT